MLVTNHKFSDTKALSELIERKRKNTIYVITPRNNYCSNPHVEFKPTDKQLKALEGKQSAGGNMPLITRRMYKYLCKIDVTKQASWILNRTKKYREDENRIRLINEVFKGLFLTHDVISGITHLSIKGLSNQVGATTYGKKLDKHGKKIASISRVSRLIDYLCELGYVKKCSIAQKKNVDTDYFEQAELRLTDKAYELVSGAIPFTEIENQRRKLYSRRVGKINNELPFYLSVTQYRKQKLAELRDSRLKFYKKVKAMKKSAREGESLQGMSDQQLHLKACETIAFLYDDSSDKTLLAKQEYHRLKTLRNKYAPPEEAETAIRA